MNASQGRIKKMLRSIQNLIGYHICIKRKSSETTETDDKLLNIFNELTVGISEVFEDKPQTFDEYLRCDKVSCKINVLSEQIGQVRILYSLWKNGYDLNSQELVGKLQSLNLLVDCIRDDVFYAYLRLPPEQKMQLLKKNKQVSAIFAVLGTLENEVTEMMKTMFPNDELIKAVRPLLKPSLNRVLYRRQAKSFCIDSPAYQTVQFSCKKVTYEKPKLVDAWTDPVEQVDCDCDELYGIHAINAIDDLEPGHRIENCNTENAACQVSLVHDDYDDFLVMENTVTFTELKSPDSISIDRLSVVKSDDDAGHLFLKQTPITCSRQCSDTNSLRHDLSFWRIAADMIAEHPVES